MTRRKRPFAVSAAAPIQHARAAEARFTVVGGHGGKLGIPRHVSAGCGLAWKAETSEEQVLLDALCETGIGFETHALVELFD